MLYQTVAQQEKYFKLLENCLSSSWFSQQTNTYTAERVCLYIGQMLSILIIEEPLPFFCCTLEEGILTYAGLKLLKNQSVLTKYEDRF